MVGKRASEPMSVVYFQQRSHFCAGGAFHLDAQGVAAARSSSTWETMNRPGSSRAYCSSSG